ncbi:c-type cytochrome [Salinisphaera orenii]|uniref:Alcohol dehydrogenase n=1 Tax=Salinisphaera orenii YIM 95161 TaxID=1051139 RepID=A0A423Q712_9GAMM|nr:cytochrome c [Salinisphaera halophila]ROO35199.1 alcohol dehydrogenase [Salinisphaera halophila YIM 95161]
MHRLLPILLLLLTAAPAVGATDSADAERGEYLARIGNCAGCHTAPDGEPFAGGLRLDSPYGTFITPNITPDAATGIGDWNADDLWAAMHEGERADGSPLYPACPYPSYTRVERDDIDAIHAYLETVPAVAHETPAHDLDWPYGYRPLVNLWQALYFEPGTPADTADADPVRARGRYLVEGLGHCDGCHRARGTFGATDTEADAPGAMIHGWYAPPLADPAQAGLQDWPVAEAAALLRGGRTEHAATMGPMADVVFDSLQYLSSEDARAMATYLKSIPARTVPSPERLIGLSERGREVAMREGGRIYANECADCHGDEGEGGDGAPALAGNRAVTMDNPVNVANMIRRGGFPPATADNPRPYGMPPFHQLSERELAAVISYIRGSWGNDAAPVSATNLRR